MSIHWQVKFKSLRAGTDYTVSIYDSTYTGTPVELKGAANPFVTEEDATEDMFTPIRTQSGYLRIVDDGKDANGNTFNWKDILPETDTDRPVILTSADGQRTTTYWQGFLQAQTFSGTLYGNPQVREFPVQCVLSSLSSINVPTDQIDIQNFASLVRYIFTAIGDLLPVQTPFSYYIFQGGNDARHWLQKLFDWQNFINVTEDGVEPKYSLAQVLEDLCKFWGWTCRTWRNQVIFTCADDTTEPNALSLTTANLTALANDKTGQSTAGSVSSMFETKAVGDIFADVELDDEVIRGISRAEVKADCNRSDDLITFAPESVRKIMESSGYTWVQDGGDEMVGYFTTNELTSFTSQFLTGLGGQYGGFARRQIYSTADAADAAICDCILVKHSYNGNGMVLLETNRERIFSGGSLRFSGNIYKGAELYSPDHPEWQNFTMRLGIGSSYQTAKWFYFDIQDNYQPKWGTSLNSFRVNCNFNVCFTNVFLIPHPAGDYPAIPVAENMYGKVFVEIMGSDSLFSIGDEFQIANFKVEYSRNVTALGQRTRTLQVNRSNTRKYVGVNIIKGDSLWNADCIFASDNDMEYGYGLLMNPADGSVDAGKFMTTVTYGASSQRPEQHLANRAAAYWSGSKRKMTAPLLSNGMCDNTVARDISPRMKLTLDGTTAFPVSISQDWWNDVTTISIIEL